jgi:site-specific recombinase XerD
VTTNIDSAKPNLATNATHQAQALANAIELWAHVTTAPDLRRAKDIFRDKRRAITEFFAATQKPLSALTPLDVRDWHTELIKRGLKSSTIYVRLSHLSSFFEWLRREPELGAFVKINVARMALPKAPKPYQNEKAKSLTDDELARLWQTLEAEKNTGAVVGLRDYAIFRLFMATGMRRSEILHLSGLEVAVKSNGLLLHTRVKGGDYRSRMVDDAESCFALLAYLEKTSRAQIIGTPRPLWLRHDRADPNDETALSSHAFDKRMKYYAARAGLPHFHLHQLRHTYARIVSEESGSITATQDALGHRNLATTRVYVERIGIKRDAFSRAVRDRIAN